MHWTSKGWIDERSLPPPDDHAHAIACGLMFLPFTGTLREVTARARA